MSITNQKNENQKDDLNFALADLGRRIKAAKENFQSRI